MARAEFERQIKEVRDKLESALTGFELFEDRFSPAKLAEKSVQMIAARRKEVEKSVGGVIEVSSKVDNQKPAKTTN